MPFVAWSKTLLLTGESSLRKTSVLCVSEDAYPTFPIRLSMSELRKDADRFADVNISQFELPDEGPHGHRRTRSSGPRRP